MGQLLTRPVRFIGTLILLVLALVGGIAVRTLVPRTRAAAASPALGVLASNGGSSLIFGTNLGFYDAHDQFTNDAGTQQLAQHMGVSIVRFPFRSSQTDSYDLLGLQAIKNIGAAPLVIVHGAADTNAPSDDAHELSLVQQVFGASTVYVEFGNEEDLAGINVTTYTTAWNAVIPGLKSQAPTYKFIGPVNFQANPTYDATFAQHANPQPDYISWHEYTCGTSYTDSSCMQNIQKWTTHIQNTNAAVQAAIGHTIPIMITEWNLDPQQDPRYTNQSFIVPWMQSALQTLLANRSNGIVAAMQYVITNDQGFDLIDGGGNLTHEGQVFQQLALQNGGGTAPQPATPAPVAPTATPTGTAAATPTPGTIPVPQPPTATPAAGSYLYSFEDGSTDGWSGSGSQVSAVANSTRVCYEGTHALAVTFSGLAGSTYPMVRVAKSVTGSAYTMHVYVPVGTPTIYAKLLAQNTSYQFVGANYAALHSGWNTLTLSVPSDRYIQLAAQFYAGSGSVTGSVYLDAVSFQ